MFENYQGIINLEEYFKDKYNYQYISINDLRKQPFIEYEAVGKNALFWIIDGNDRYLFKRTTNALGEIISMKIANILNIDCAEYRIATIGGETGILSKKFNKEDDNIILGAQIIQEVLNNYPKLFPNGKNEIFDDQQFIELYGIPDKILKLDPKNRLKYIHNNLNNLEELSSILSIFFKTRKVVNYDDVLKNTMDYLVKTFLFDCITIQADRHIENWGIGQKVTGEFYNIPLYDNSACLNLYHENLEERIMAFYRILETYKIKNNPKTLKELKNMMYKDKMLLSVSERDIINPTLKKRKSNLEMLDYFLNISDYEYIGLFIKYLDTIEEYRIDRILDEIQIEYGINIKENVRDYIIILETMNLSFLREISNKYRREDELNGGFKRT